MSYVQKTPNFKYVKADEIFFNHSDYTLYSILPQDNFLPMAGHSTACISGKVVSKLMEQSVPANVHFDAPDYGFQCLCCQRIP